MGECVLDEVAMWVL